jgi:hypothetical protein
VLRSIFQERDSRLAEKILEKKESNSWFFLCRRLVILAGLIVEVVAEGFRV